MFLLLLLLGNISSVNLLKNLSPLSLHSCQRTSSGLVKLGVDKLPNVSSSVFRDLRNNSLSMKDFPTDAFSGLKSLKEM